MKKTAFIYLVVILFTSCAIQVAPQGGEKDVLPPKILKTIPENFSINVKPTDIVLSFDEFIVLNDVNTQLVVSPLLKYAPETKIRKKSVTIHFLDTLEENTTYTLNFGNAIADNNEGNVLENYQFVFSTGSVVDSLKIEGKIEYAFDHKIDKALLALIYKETDDSLPFIKRPMYFAKTNTEGEFSINNIAPGNYKLIALEDKDGNYLYTSGEENVGFSDSLISAGSEKVFIRLFKESQALRLSKSISVSPGKVFLVFSAAADTLKINWLSDLKKLDIYSQQFSEQKDTLTILYKNTEMDSLSFYYFDGKRMDTVDVRLFKKGKQVLQRGKFELELSATDPTSVHHFYQPYRISSNHPLVNLDTAGIILKKDSTEQNDYRINFSDSLKTSFEITSKWDEKSNYELFLPPSTVEDIYGLKNDTVKLQWTIRPEVYYGTMFLKMNSFKGSIVVQLLDEKDFLIRQSIVSGDTTIKYLNLDPMVYRIKIIYDDNSNKIWDTGNLLKHIQPERTEYYPEKITIRANWDVDVKWDRNIIKTK